MVFCCVGGGGGTVPSFSQITRQSDCWEAKSRARGLGAAVALPAYLRRSENLHVPAKCTEEGRRAQQQRHHQSVNQQAAPTACNDLRKGEAQTRDAAAAAAPAATSGATHPHLLQTRTSSAPEVLPFRHQVPVKLRKPGPVRRGFPLHRPGDDRVPRRRGERGKRRVYPQVMHPLQLAHPQVLL